MDAPAIRLDGLTKHYGAVRALSAVDLTVERGEIFGFLGPNGAGKTTAIRILLDLIRPTAGRAEVLGFDAQRQSLEVRRRVGYLPGDLRLYDRMTGLEFLELIASLRGEPVDVRYRDRLIARLQLDPGRPIGTLSHGNRQKVGIVQALMTRPQLLVLDEPTSWLDPLMQEEMQSLLREVTADGRSVFFSSHDLSEVEQVCSRVAMLRDGRLIDVVVPAEARRLAPQRFAVSFAAPPPRDAFAALAGVQLVSLAGAEVVFEARDGVDALVRRLASFTVTRLETHELSLDELFRSYYAPGAEDAPGGRASRAEEAVRADPA